MPDSPFEHVFPALPAGGMDGLLRVHPLIDTSGSMRGPALEAALYAVRVFKAQAEDDPYASERITVGNILQREDYNA